MSKFSDCHGYWRIQKLNMFFVDFVFKMEKSSIPSLYGKLHRMKAVIKLINLSNIDWSVIYFPNTTHIRWFKSVFLISLLLHNMCRGRSPSAFSASTVCLSLWHTLALSQSVALTLYCKQAVQGQFVMYLHILLLLSISRGTWQSTLWLWTSTTCSSSMPVCCMNGASSLPQASLALWVHSLQVSVSAAVSYQLCPVRHKGRNMWENGSNAAAAWRTSLLNI